MRKLMSSLVAVVAVAGTCPVLAEPAIDVGADYVVDVVAVSGTGLPGKPYWLDNLDLTATADLDELIGLRGTRVHLHMLNNLGGMPNNRAATLPGVDNIEVGSQRLRVFELWAEQQLGPRTTLRAGLYDLNSEFYANDAAGLLIAPAFGVGSEIAATGPNGPSIFPSTAIAARIDHRFSEAAYLRVAVLNAAAGTLGDPQGVDFSFDNGALLVAEAGVEGRGKLSMGVWGYSDRQPHIRRLDAAGAPAGTHARGVYVVAEWPVVRWSEDHALTGFVRAGASDGRTTPFRGGWQAGLLWSAPFRSRPESAISIGANQGVLAKGWRRNMRDLGVRTAWAETAFELTASDRLAPHLTLQPDLQLVLDPGGDRRRGSALVSSLRITLDF